MVVMDNILDRIGFSEYKKRAYIALLSLEKAKVGEIAKRANIPSSKIYEILNWLYAKGYISIVSPHPLIYRANDPKPIIGSEIKSQMSILRTIEEELKKSPQASPEIQQAMVFALDWATILSKGYKDDTYLTAIRGLQARLMHVEP